MRSKKVDPKIISSTSNREKDKTWNEVNLMDHVPREKHVANLGFLDWVAHYFRYSNWDYPWEACLANFEEMSSLYHLCSNASLFDLPLTFGVWIPPDPLSPFQPHPDPQRWGH